MKYLVYSTHTVTVYVLKMSLWDVIKNSQSNSLIITKTKGINTLKIKIAPVLFVPLPADMKNYFLDYLQLYNSWRALCLCLSMSMLPFVLL